MRRKSYITVEVAENKDTTNEFVLGAIKDSFIRSYTPAQLTLSDPDNFFILYMPNKRLVMDIEGLPDYSEYVDVYLYGKKQLNSTYGVVSDGIDITITFNQSIISNPFDVVNTDFIVKANICEIPQ